MKIIIFGANGFIGKSVVNKLLENKVKVICFDIHKESQLPKKVEYYKCDLVNINKYKNKIKKADIFLNLVGWLGVRETQKDPFKTYLINLIYQSKWLEIIKEWKIKKVVFISSSEIYGDINLKAVNELSPVSPKSDYAVSKLAVENLLRVYAKKYKFEYNIIRYFNIYGPDQREEFVIPKFIKLALKGKDLNYTGNGSQVRAFCYIDDAVDITIKVILSNKCKNEDFNIGNNKEPISIKELAHIIKKLSHSDSKIRSIPFSKADRSKRIEVFYRRPNTNKLTKFLNYSPNITLRNGIQKIYDSKKNK